MGWESERDSEMGRSTKNERDTEYSSSIKLIGPQ